MSVVAVDQRDDMPTDEANVALCQEHYPTAHEVQDRRDLVPALEEIWPQPTHVIRIFEARIIRILEARRLTYVKQFISVIPSKKLVRTSI